VPIREESLSKKLYSATHLPLYNAINSPLLESARHELEERAEAQRNKGYSEVMVRAGFKAAVQRLAMSEGYTLEASFLDWLIDPRDH
jgi:hypothetical protein